MFNFIILTFLCVCVCWRPHLVLSPQQHYLTLYTHHQQIYFSFDFNSTKMFVSKQYADLNQQQIFFDRERKHSIKKNQETNKFTFQVFHMNKQIDQSGQQHEEAIGVIGLKKGSYFQKIIKNVFNWEQVKFKFKIYQNKIDLLPQKCSQMMFPPYQIRISTDTKTEYLKINQLSLNFSLDSKTFLSLLNKKQNPFILTNEDSKIRFEIQLANEHQSLPLKTLIKGKCRKISETENQECNFVKSPESYGLILFEFDPTICIEQNSIELGESEKVQSKSYYSIHCFLLTLQILIIVLFRHRHTLYQKYLCFVKNSKYWRNP